MTESPPNRRLWLPHGLMVAGALSGLAAFFHMLPMDGNQILAVSSLLLIAAGLLIEYRRLPEPKVSPFPEPDISLFPHPDTSQPTAVTDMPRRPFQFSLRTIFVVVTVIALFLCIGIGSMRLRSAVREVARRAAERQEREYESVEYVKKRTGQNTDEWASWVIKTDTGFEVHVQRIPKNGQHYIFLYSDDGTYDGSRGNAP